MARELSGLMEDLAVSLAKETAGPTAPDRDRVDAFKSLSSYYLGTEKLNRPDDDSSANGFSGIRTRLAAVDGGKVG